MSKLLFGPTAKFVGRQGCLDVAHYHAVGTAKIV